MKKLRVLPPTKCDAGCGACCGPVPVTETEYQRIRRYVVEHAIKPEDRGELECPLYLEGTCSVYPVRPTLCKLFGHVEKMTCPRGYNVNVPDRQASRMLRSAGLATRMLSDILLEPR